MRIAFTTFAVLRAPYGDALVKGFEDRTPTVFQAAENSPGFLARAKELSGSDSSNFERDWGPWGEFCVPRFYRFGRTNETDQRASTLSLWKNLPSVYRFAYGGAHLEALRKRAEWFLQPNWPTYAIWWVADDHTPQWREAALKLELLFDNGPAPVCFSFKQCFDEQGQPITAEELRAWRP